MNESNTLSAYVRAKQHERDELQRQVDEFHRLGGRTQTLKFGETSGLGPALAPTFKRRKQR